MSNKKIHIITAYHLEEDYHLRLGGQDVYIDDLAKTLLKNNFDVIVHEMTPFSSFTTKQHGYLDIGYSGFDCFSLNNKKNNRAFFKAIKQSGYFSEGDLVIFGNDYSAYGNVFHPSIAVQHGIAWDVPFEKQTLQKKIKFIFLTQRKIAILNGVDSMVCVDYNYPNWLRANYGLVSLMDKITVIPNYAFSAKIQGPKTGNKEALSIVFARRFWKPRGTEIVSKAILELSSRPFFGNLKFFLAGDGPEKNKMMDSVGSFANVFFEDYPAGFGVDYHLDKDIALVPTYGSEGTSLSALEALSASCALICSGVGGLSNIVISEFNGLLIKPDSKELSAAIERLYFDRPLLSALQVNGKRVAELAFGKSLWEKRWIQTVARFIS